MTLLPLLSRSCLRRAPPRRLSLTLQMICFTTSSSDKKDHDLSNNHDAFQEQMMELQEERQQLFGFSDEEHDAWSNLQKGQQNQPSTNATTVGAFLDQQIALQQQTHLGESDPTSFGTTTSAQDANVDNNDAAAVLTHLSEDQTSASMVDVGSKAITKRVAKARSKVVFPPEVLLALSPDHNDIVGPKGPIFATAKLAGIMAAKRTSDLIPLCHPLPMDKVHVDIRLDGNTAIVECECRVTHKTGVEMEALVGASVAALTIYDMVKAVSHRVTIEETELISKTGGKRTV